MGLVIRLAEDIVVVIAVLLVLPNLVWGLTNHRPDVILFTVGELVIVGVLVLAVRALRRAPRKRLQ